MFYASPFLLLLINSAYVSPQNGILRSTTTLRGTTVLLQPKPKHASGMTPFHVVGVKLIFFGDITTKLGPILCSAWHWLQQPPRFETLKYYKEKKIKERCRNKNLSTQVIRATRRFHLTKKFWGVSCTMKGLYNITQVKGTLSVPISFTT